MSVTFNETIAENVVEIELSGKLTAKDYETCVPELERRIKEVGKLRLLVVLRDFHGWEVAALWEDIKFDFKHFRDFQRLALVGDSKWEAGMATFCKPFTTATIKYFDLADVDQARAWVAEASN